MEYLNDKKITGQSSGDVLRGILSTIFAVILIYCYYYIAILIFRIEPLIDNMVLDYIPKLLLVFYLYSIIEKIKTTMNNFLRTILWGNISFK